MLETLLALFIFLLPFQFALQPAEGVDLAIARVLAVGIFLLWGMRSLAEKRLVLPRPLPLFFFTAFLLWTSASFLWADSSPWALRKSVFLLSFLPLFLVFSGLFRESRVREKVFRAFVAGAALVATIAIVEFCLQFVFGVEKMFALWTGTVLPFFLGPAFGESVASHPSLLANIAGTTVLRASGFFPDPHMAAFFFGMSLPIAIVFVLGDGNQIRKRWIACAGAILIADLLTFSRGGYIGLIFGLGAFIFLFLSWTAAWKKRALQISVGSLIIAIMVVASPVGTRLLSSFSQTDTSNIERLRLWQEATELILDRPITGVGLGNYPLAVKPSAEYREPIYAHNLYLDIALEIGITGLLFFILFLCYGLLCAWRRWRGEHSVFHLAIFSSLIIFSVHAFFETPLFSVHVLPALVLLLAGSMAPSHTGQRG
ncbi:MAG: O-antigen ligase family protein [Candidatus Moraniibacteriota bacterium]